MSSQAFVQTQTAKPASTPVAHGLLHRCTATAECDECKKKRLGTLQRAAINSSPVDEVPQIVHEVLRSPGQPLDRTTRAFMEPRFAHDFSNVRLHTDAKAAESARAVNALAYTVGGDIVFGKGEHAPYTTKGRKLMAHELTHVVQQSVSSLPGTSLNIENSDVAEREADCAVEYLLSGQGKAFHPFSRGSALQRAPAPPENSFASMSLEDAIQNLPRMHQDQALLVLKRYQQFIIRSITSGEGRIRELTSLRAESFSNYLIGGTIEVFGGTSLPSDNWEEPWRSVNAAYSTLSKRQVKETYDHLHAAVQATLQHWEQLNKYLEHTEKGADRSIATLRAVRDVSFVVVGAVGTVVTGGALGGAIIGTGVTALGQVAEQGTSVAIGIQKEIDWSGIAFDAILGFVLSLLGGKIAQRLAGSAGVARLAAQNPAVTQFLESIGKQFSETAWKEIVKRAVVNVIYGRAQSTVHSTARLIFDRLRGQKARLTGGQFVDVLLEQLLSPRAYFMDILGGEIGVLAHGYLQGGGAAPTTSTVSEQSQAIAPSKEPPAPATREPSSRPPVRGATAEGVGNEFHYEYHPESSTPDIQSGKVNARSASTSAPAEEVSAPTRQEENAPLEDVSADIAGERAESTEGTDTASRSPSDVTELENPANPNLEDEMADLAASERPEAQIEQQPSVDVARLAGVPDEVLHSGTVFTRSDFPDLVPEGGLPDYRNAPELLPLAEELRRGVAGREPTTNPDPTDVQHTELQGDIELMTRHIEAAGGKVVEVAINRRQRAGAPDAPTAASRYDRPDSQIAYVDGQLNGRRITIEYDRAPGSRAEYHAQQILLRDPTAIVILKIIGFD